MTSLSDREQETVALAATGLRNREIAARLFVTQSAVEQRLTSAYRKLGVRRPGLAAVLRGSR